MISADELTQRSTKAIVYLAGILVIPVVGIAQRDALTLTRTLSLALAIALTLTLTLTLRRSPSEARWA